MSEGLVWYRPDNDTLGKLLAVLTALEVLP